MFRIARTIVVLLGAATLLGTPVASADDRHPPRQPIPQQQVCDCEDTSVFATWYNVGGRFDNNRIDVRHVKLHLLVDCVAGQGAECSGSASASVKGATAVPGKIDVSCTASGACPEKMEATKIVKLRRKVSAGAGNVTITVTHRCADGAVETTTLTIAYNRRGWPMRGQSDLNGDGNPDRIS